MAAAGNSPWIPINRYVSAFGVALGLIFSSNKNLTAEVQYTLDPLVDQLATVTRSTTTATAILPNHGLSVGDSVVAKGPAPFAGTYAVAAVTDQDTFTFTVANSGSTGAQVQLIPLRVQVHADLTGKTADAVGNFAFPPTACRLTVTPYTAGYVDLDVVSAGK